METQRESERAGENGRFSFWHWLILPAISVARTLTHFHCCYLSVPIRREYFDRVYNLTRVYVQQSITVPMSSSRRYSMHWNVLWALRRSVAAMNNKCNQWSVISARVNAGCDTFFFSLSLYSSSISIVVSSSTSSSSLLPLSLGGISIALRNLNALFHRAHFCQQKKNAAISVDDDDNDDSDWANFNFQFH